jgi:hypothetical protein
MADKVYPVGNSSETMYKDAPDSYAGYAKNITKSDSVELNPWPRAIRVGSAGDVTVKNVRGETVLFKDCLAGERIECVVTHVMATGTVPTSFVAYYG